MSLNYVQLLITQQDAGQDAGSGAVTITPTSKVTAAGVTVVSQAPLVRQLSSGTLTVQLVASDNSGTSPASGFWAYNVQLPNETVPTPYLVNFSGGASQRLDSLAPVVASTTYGPAAGSGGFANPLTTLGDIMYENATPAAAALPGNTTTAKQFLTQTGTGTASAAPAWGPVQQSDLPAATALAQGAVQFDATAADMQPAGVPSTGKTPVLKVAYADHVHPWQPWQFAPESYGAQGDMHIAHDVAITSGQPTLTTAGVANPTTAPTLATATTGGTVAAGTYQVVVTYVSATGETVASSSASITTTGSTSTITVTTPAANGVPGGATGWNAYITAAGGSTFFKQMTVTSPWPFPNNYILAAPPSVSNPQPPGANTTTSSPWAGMKAGQAIRVIGAGAAGADLLTTILSVGGSSATLSASAGTTVARSGSVWGTDDTSAVQQAINAAAAYTVATNRTGEVLLSKLYLSSTAPTVGGTYAGNCVLQLPSIPNGAAKVRVSIIGVSKDVSTLPVYQQMVPEASGPGVIYIGPNGTNDATYGPAHVIGTPTLPAIYVTESGNTPGTTNIKVMMDSVRVIVPFAGGIGGIDLFSAAQSANYNCSVQALGIVPSGGSWTRILANGPTTSQWGWGLREPAAGNNAQSYTEQFTCEGLCYGYGPSEHLVAVDIFVAYCVNGFQAYSGNGISMVHNAHILSGGAEFCANALGADVTGGIKIDIDNFRTESVGKQVLDASSRLQGTIGLRCQGTTGQYSSSFINAGTVTGMRIVNMMTTPGPISAPQAPVASGSPWPNYYYRDAWITLSATTITGLTITSQGGGTTVAQAVPSGATTYGFFLPSGCSYTWTGTGTLAHTVTLL